MAGKSATLTVKILSDASEAGKGLAAASGEFDKFQAGLDKITPAAAVTVGAIALVGKQAYDSASRLEQSMGALDSVFGSNADTVKAWAADAAQSAGLAESEYAELASVIGAQLNNLGLSADDAMSGTQGLIDIGADLAATFGGSTAEAVEALSSALRGEADPAERYGLSLNQTAVNAKLAEQGLTGLTGEALKTAQTQAILQLATEQAGGALGQFDREADTAAGATQRAGAEIENASAAIGEQLLPFVADAATAFAGMAKWIGQNTGIVTAFVAVVGGLAAAILIVNGAIKAWQIATAAWSVIQGIATGVQWAWNAAMTANPIGLVIVAVVALVAAFVLLWNNSEAFRDFFIGMWDAIVVAVTAAWEWIVAAVQTAIDWIVNAWQVVVDAATAAWDWIVNAVNIAIALISAYIQAYVTVVMWVWNAIVTAAQAAWNWVVSAVQTAISSISSIVQGVGAFIGNIWTNILRAGENVWRTLERIVGSVMDAIMVPINAVADAFNAVIDAIKGVIDWISRIKIPDLSALNPFAATASTASVAFAAPAGVGASPTFARATGFGAVPGGGGGAGIVININGGLDSADTIARRIERILSDRARRTGGVVIARRNP